MASSFIHESFNSSVDFPTYIPWQTLSSDLSDKLKHGSLRLNRSNRIEYATIHEEGERVPLSEVEHTGSIVTPAVRSGASWPVAAFLLVNAALGAGVLNYPYAYHRAGGVYFAAFLQVLMVFLLISTMLVLAYCADLNYDNTYHDVLLSMCGRRAQQCAALSILMTCFGICITFLIIIGDQYDRFFASLFGSNYCEFWYLDRSFTIPATSIVFILPMCYFQRLDFLRYASTLGIFAMLYPVFLTIYEYYKLEGPRGVINTYPQSAIEVFVVVPVICFAYQTHEIVVPVYACMRNRNLADFTKATFLALGFLMVIYCMAGSFGYLTFGSYVAPDIMQQYDATDPIVLIGVCALVIKMITTYPPLLLCGRGALDGLYAEFSGLTADEFISGEKRRRVIITSVWFIATVLLAVFTPNISVVIELLGCLASINIFVFPGMCLVSLMLKEDPDMNEFRTRCLLTLAGVMIAFGSFIFGVVVIQVLMYDLQKGGEEHHQLCS
ncbi:putative sodium-coupled neutral amino acid transporter 7 isoform X1 [Centruroides sculpturatus]|uniref:putative sodium-coupled neutral amino acid transporter 7 isoform X1 n=1 Tax=Centruroides sculpturatus TaxID=218467 RepID=UPI000C6E18F5|nr:putative sodium-coupled neutral amino acid transporter 7 isoform X1 [Centruroides sculpturatus]